MANSVTVKDYTPKVLKVVHKLTEEGLISFTEKATERTKDKAPILTGNHRGLTGFERVGKNSTRIFSASGYGVHLEFGTKYMAARPHFAPGIKETIREFQKGSKWA
jgi:hypothetical protein